MFVAYGWDTPIAKQIVLTVSLGRPGRILLLYTFSFSHFGSSEGFQLRMAANCLVWVADRRASALGLWVAMRPNFACARRFSRFTMGTQFKQKREPVVTVPPQTPQRGLVLGRTGVVERGVVRSARLRFDCVNLVGRGLNGDRLSLPCQKILAASSAYGATARRQVIAVCESSAANSPINRQFPFACSKNQFLRKGPRLSQSKTYASTRGLTGSIKSQARLSRFGVSRCSTPRPGSSPSSAAARRASASSIA